jgi:hypothetical protein
MFKHFLKRVEAQDKREDFQIVYDNLTYTHFYTILSKFNKEWT